MQKEKLYQNYDYLLSVYQSVENPTIDVFKAHFPQIHQDTLRYWIRKHGMILSRPRTYTLNENIFDVIDTEEKAYWIGFLLADGYISTKGKEMTLLLQEKDLEHLIKLQNFLGTNAPIKKKTNTNSFFLTVASRKLCNDLRKHSVYTNKTFTLKFPDVHHNLTRHVVRGYFDGDGWLGSRQASLIVSSLYFKETLTSVFIENGFQEFKEYRCGAASTRLSFGRKNSDFIDFMYKDSSIFLNRKKEMYTNNWYSYREVLKVR